MTIADTNAIGKHLNKAKGQDDPLNRAILEVLEKIADLEDSGDAQMEEVAIHAAAIRNAFFDDNKRIENVIPPVLLVSVKDREEIAPRRVGAVRAVRKSTSSASSGRAVRRTTKKKKTSRKR